MFFPGLTLLSICVPLFLLTNAEHEHFFECRETNNDDEEETCAAFIGTHPDAHLHDQHQIDGSESSILSSENQVESDDVVPDLYKDLHDECVEWAEEGLCNIDPKFMLRECIHSCLSHPGTHEYGLLAWSLYEGKDRGCRDTYNIRKRFQVDPNCESWANDGLCLAPSEKEFMLSRCQRSCMVCIPQGEIIEFDLGEGQFVPKETLIETLDILIDMADYMKTTVMDTRNELYHSTRLACRNKDEMCAVWAAEGFCDADSEDYEWMVLNCAPVCQTCELLDFQLRCPIPDNAIDALNVNGGENGLHSMFERIVGERNLTETQIDGGMQNLSFNIKIYSRPGGSQADSVEHTIVDGPWVVALEDFLSAEECQKLIEVGQKLGYHPSLETSTLKDGSLKEDFTSDARTSTNTWCNDEIIENSVTSCKDDPIVKRIMERISLITGFPTNNSEDLQLLHYKPGQYYKIHHDYIAAHAYGPSGPRVLTFFLYLNDVEEGGGTRFPALSPNAAPLTVQPKLGTALLWPSVLDENINEKDDRTEHEALAVIKGVKYGANAWLHLRDEQNIHGIECG